MKKKRLFTFITAIMMMFSIFTTLPVKISVPLETNAAYENTHTNTGNQRADIVAIAQTQVGYHEGSLEGTTNGNDNYTKYNKELYAIDGSYKYMWCQSFIAWCAKQADVSSDVIKRTAGTVDAMDFFKAQGVWQERNYIPQSGDIIYFTSSSSNSGYHVGIVESVSGSTINTIEGNYSDKVGRHSVTVGSSSIVGYGVPNYVVPDPNPPTNVTLSKNQVWYDIKDTITLNATSDNATTYWISVLKDGTSIINTQISGELSFSASDYGYGDYEAWVSAVNSAGYTDSNHIDFSIVGAATYTGIHTSKDVYFTDETVIISVDTVCAKGQVIGIDNVDTGRVITEACDNTYIISADSLGIGEYSAYFSVYNGSGGIDTEKVSFTIYDKSLALNMKSPTVYSDKKYYYDNNLKVNILWNKIEGAEGYWIDIYKDDEHIISENLKNTLSYSNEFSNGKYDVFVAAYNSYNGWNTAVSEVYEFSVYNKSLASNMKPPIVHTESTYYKPDSEVKISWNEVETAVGYWIDIYKDDEHIISENLGNITSYSNTFSKGKYDVCVAAYNLYNGWNTAVSEVYEFSLYGKGDINFDGYFNVSDVVLLQKWLLGMSNTELANWKAADLCEDGKLDVFDMIEMRKLLIQNNNSLSAQ